MVCAVLTALTLLAAGGCTKQVPLVVDEADVTDGRPMAIRFNDGSQVVGRLVPGAEVRITRNDSLFVAEVESIENGFVTISRQELLTDLDDWRELARVAENSEAVANRVEIGSTDLMLENMVSVAVIEPDRRRLITEAVFWAATGIALGFAAFTR
jgi:hypothetical protein